MSYRISGLPVIALALCLLAGCDGRAPAGEALDATVAEAARDSLIKADLAFAELALNEGLPQAYLRYLADDAVQLPDGDLPIAGKEAIYENIVAVAESAEFSLTWEPVAAEVSAAGDLGYTWGVYYFEALDENGEPLSYEGKYANVWRKAPGGNWQILLDISNQNRVDYVDDLSSGADDAGRLTDAP
jgi:ketosteroid isomerase-like protein